MPIHPRVTNDQRKSSLKQHLEDNTRIRSLKTYVHHYIRDETSYRGIDSVEYNRDEEYANACSSTVRCAVPFRIAYRSK